MSKQQHVGLLNYPLESSQGLAGSHRRTNHDFECPGTPLWSSTNKKLERSKSSVSPSKMNPNQSMDLLDTSAGMTSRCSSMGILKPEDMSCRLIDEISSLFGALDERERSEEFRLASYLMAPSSEVENNNHPFCIDSTTDVSENDSKDNGKENSGEKQASSHCDKLGVENQLDTFPEPNQAFDTKFSSRSTSIGYGSCSGFSSNFKSSALSHESYGYGNLTFCKDASFCESAELADLLKEEQFLSSNSEKKKLIDEAEKQHDQMFPDKPDNSFINATTSQLEPQAILSQSSYFQLSTSRLGSLETDDGQRQKSEELRPGLGFNRIVSPKNRPFRVIKGSPREESDPVLPYPATEKELKSSSAFKNLENSFLKPQQPSNDINHSKEALIAALVKGRDNPVELAKLLFQDRSGNDKVFEELLSHLGLSKSFKPDVKVAVNQATQLLPSFLEATANQAVESEMPSSETNRRHSPSSFGKSRIPRLSPREKSKNSEIFVRHSSPLKKQKLNFAGDESKAPSMPMRDNLSVLPLTSDRNSLVWLANPVGTNETKVVTIKNMLPEQSLPLIISIKDGENFKLSDGRINTQNIVVEPGATFEIRVTFLASKPGWFNARLGIKRNLSIKGPALRAVVKLIGNCGVPKLVMEKCGEPFNLSEGRDLSLGCVTKEFYDGFSFKNEGDAIGFAKLLVFDPSSQDKVSTSIAISPAQFVILPGERRQIRINVARSEFSPGDYFQSTLVIYQGSEVLRQGWRLKTCGSKPKNVELSGNFDGENVIGEIQWLKSLQIEDQIGFEFFKSTSKTVVGLNGICSSNQPSFLALPMEETMNESQMLSQTFSSIPTFLNRPETIPEEGSGSSSKGNASKGISQLVRVDPEVIFFPPTLVGSSRQWKLKVKNGTMSNLEFKLSGLEHQPFVVICKAVQVKPMSYISLGVIYQPVSQGTHEGTLVLTGSSIILKVGLRGSTAKLAAKK